MTRSLATTTRARNSLRLALLGAGIFLALTALELRRTGASTRADILLG